RASREILKGGIPMSIAFPQHDTPVTAVVEPVSAKRLAANRRNALKSTGPRTAAGKARSKANARVKHGLCSEYAPLPGESEATFGIFVDELKAELRPRTVLQKTLFPHIANLVWRLQRLPHAERE